MHVETHVNHIAKTGEVQERENRNDRHKKARSEEQAFLKMVPVGGLEPPRPKATDFESVVYTNFTTPA